MIEQTSLHRTLCLLLRISRLFGVAPVRFAGSRAYVSSPFRFYGTILFGILSTDYVYQIYSLLTNHTSSYLTRHHIEVRLMYLLIDLVVLAVGTMMGPRRMRLMIHVLAEIDKIRNIKCTVFDRIMRFMVWSVVPVLWLIGSAHYYKSREFWSPQMFVTTYLLRTSTFLIMLHFVVLACMVNCIIRHINNCLEEVVIALSEAEIGTVAKKSFQAPLNVPLKYINIVVDSIGNVNKRSKDDTRDKLKTEAETMRGLARTYVMFWSCTRQLNVAEHFALLMYLTGFVVHLALPLLNLFEWLHNADDAEVYLWILTLSQTCATAVLSGIMLLLLVEPSHVIATELRRSRLLISKILNAAPTDQRLIDSAERLEAQLQLGYPHYSAFSVFELGRPIITTVVGVIITYLLVILQ